MPIPARTEFLNSEASIHARPTALVYDFDGTLARGNLQEQSFIPNIGMERDQFWAEVKQRTKAYDADEIFVYMQLMIDKAREKGAKVTKNALCAHGRNADLFPGLTDGTWFARVNGHAAQLGLQLDHYVISSGVSEMIQGCPIHHHFRHVFASKFIYVGDNASWPGVAINYTTKTQYLFRINKGIHNHWDNDAINEYTPDHFRPVPFERMVFIGDGYTDIPTMNMLTQKGGYSIAVYDPDPQATFRNLDTIGKLIAHDRVNFVAPADYTEDSQLDIIVKGVLSRIRAQSEGTLILTSER